MAKIELNSLTSGYNINTINVNFGKIETEFKDKVVYRNEASPMARDLDVNGFGVINLRNPVTNGDAVSYGFLLNSNAFSFTGLEYKGLWAPVTAYAKNNYVTVSGFVYIAQEAHTSSTDFLTDLGEGKWTVFSAGGGDLLSTNNLSDLTSPSNARTNLNVPSRTGENASGNWNINAATATLAALATNATLAANSTLVGGVAEPQLVKQTTSTGSAVLPVGTTAQRDLVPATGYFRYNTTIPQLEFYTGSAWSPANSSVSDGDKGDIVVSAGGTSWVVDSGSISRSKMNADAASGLSFAWVSFQGAGTVSIRRSYNVSSITDNGVGDYTITFTSPSPTANYTVAGTTSWVPGEEGYLLVQHASVAPIAASSRIATGVPGTAGTTGLTVRDSSFVHVDFKH